MQSQRVLEYDSYFCDRCREYVYNELVGEPNRGVAEKTHVEELPSDWTCPICDGSKENLRAITLVDDYFENSDVNATVVFGELSGARRE